MAINKEVKNILHRDSFGKNKNCLGEVEFINKKDKFEEIIRCKKCKK